MRKRFKPLMKVNGVNMRQLWRRIKKPLLFGTAGLLGLLLLVQIFYPGAWLLPFETVDDRNFSMTEKSKAATELDDAYKKQKVKIHIGKADKPYLQPKFDQMGMKVKNQERIDDMNYAWYWRLVPTSLFWAHFTTEPNGPEVATSKKTSHFLDKELMPTCKVAPKNASLKTEKNKLVVVKSVPGGKCKREKMASALDSVQPSLADGTKISAPVEPVPAAISDKAARAYGDKLQKRIGAAVYLKVGAELVKIPSDQVASWLEFSTTEKEIVPSLNGEKAADYLAKNIAPKVARPAGVTKITTRDFTVISRTVGATGQTLDNTKTLQLITEFITEKSETATVAAVPVPPRQEFTRSYSATDAGLSALLENYAKDNKGKFGISLTELSGKGRRADYNGDTKFVTASTYKLFVAYSTLRRVEAGTWSWNDSFAGQTAAACFDKMIVNSDNPCAEAFLNKIGLKTQTKEINALGLKNSNFMESGGPFTTANDLVVFLGSLESGQSLQGESRAKLIGAMKRNVYRNGVPAGTSGAVANKVGFIGGLLHDAAIVYSPSGTYVLAVMTDGSSWEAIAGLTKEIEKIRGS